MDFPAAATTVEEVRSLVGDQARRWRRLQLIQALILTLAAPLGCFAVACLLDVWLHLPVVARLAAALGFLTLTAWLGWRLRERWRSARLSDDAAALAMEQATSGGVQNRLINALQLARGDAVGDAVLGQAALRENCVALRQVRLGEAYRGRSVQVAVSAAALLLMGIGSAALLAPDQFANAASRLLLPMASIAPHYRTMLIVEPGDAEVEGNELAVTVRIEGERPTELVFVRDIAGARREERVAVESDADTITHTLGGIDRSQTYTVRGGDFSSPVYQIEAARSASLAELRATLMPPDYTGQESQIVTTAGDLEALAGTRADVVFTFDQSIDCATLLVKQQVPVELERVSASEFRGSLVLSVSTSYQLETQRGARPADRSGVYALRARPDQPPRLELSGLAGVNETALEATLPVVLRATDDLGLDQVGLFARRAALDSRSAGDEGWAPLQLWPGERKTELRREFNLKAATLGVGEGERVEIAIRARDTAPARVKTWVTGPSFTLTIGGEGVLLQLQYEQILRTEVELKAVLAAQRELEEKSAGWLRKLDVGSGIRWDEPKNLDMLHAAIAGLAKEQRGVQSRASAAARAMTPLAGNLRLSVGLLADAEMTRAARALDSVPSQEQPRKRSAVGDARVIQERTGRSLVEIIEQYIAFRHDWETANAIPFIKMLADRQAVLRDESLRVTTVRSAAFRRVEEQSPPKSGTPTMAAAIAAKRQAKLRELVGLIEPACAGVGQRLGELEPTMAAAFGKASAALKAETLSQPLAQALAVLQAGNWNEALPHQTEAARQLAAIHEQLRKAQADAARNALRALEEKAKSDAEAQKAIDKLKAGNDKTFLKDIPAKMELTDVIHMQEQLQNKAGGADEKLKPNDYLFSDAMRGMLQQPDTGKRQQFDILKLATSPSKTPSFPKQSDREANTVKPHIQEKFDDLVGKLLEEADEINEKYETYNLNAGVNINEPGEIGKQGGDLNSTAAAAATGNMKPPTTNVGGATRSGRQGARAHGMTVGDQSINRRGRDKVQEGQERVGDQAGKMKQLQSDDPQKDTSTGVGGKKVDADETKFSTADKGKFTDDMAKRLDKAQAKNFIVERGGGKLDPKLAELFRNIDNRQEQLIERIKAIRKELRNLYLPTEHLDELEDQLKASLDRLKDRPDADSFRLHQETLDKLRSAVRVFQAPAGGVEASVPREQVLRGRVLDDPARLPPPGYENAVKQYYERLSR